MLESLSAWNRVMQCPASSRLPHAPRAEMTDGPAARGTAIHQFLADIPKHGAVSSLVRVPPAYQEDCAAIDLEGLPVGPGFIQELALAWNLRTGEVRELGRNVGRAYDALDPSEPWLPGTLDVVGVYDGMVYVADYKTGHGGERYAPAAARNWQVRLGAMMCAKLYGRSRASVEIVHVSDEGWHWKSTAEMDALDLEMVEDQALDAWARTKSAAADIAAGRTPPVTPGLMCRYCPAFAACPTQSALLVRAARDPDAVGADLSRLVGADDATRAYLVWQALKRLTDDVGAQVTAVALRDGIQLPGGLVYGTKPGAEPKTRKSLDADVAFSVVTEVLGAEAAKAAVSMKTSEAALRRAVDVAGSSNKAGVVRDLLRIIGEKGVVSETESKPRLDVYPMA